MAKEPFSKNIKPSLSKKEVLNLAKAYIKHNKGKKLYPEVKDEISFYEVGHNASVIFFLGFKLVGRNFRFYSLNWIPDNPETPNVKDCNYQEISSLPGYIGHYLKPKIARLQLG